MTLVKKNVDALTKSYEANERKGLVTFEIGSRKRRRMNELSYGERVAIIHESEVEYL